MGLFFSFLVGAWLSQSVRAASPHRQVVGFCSQLACHLVAFSVGGRFDDVFIAQESAPCCGACIRWRAYDPCRCGIGLGQSIRCCSSPRKKHRPRDFEMGSLRNRTGHVWKLGAGIVSGRNGRWDGARLAARKGCACCDAFRVAWRSEGSYQGTNGRICSIGLGLV